MVARTKFYLSLAVACFFAGAAYFVVLTMQPGGIEEKPSLENWRQMMKVETLNPKDGFTTYRLWYLPSFEKKHVITLHEQQGGGTVTDKCGWRKEDGSFEYTQSTNPVSEESVRHLKQLLTTQHFWRERYRRIKLEELAADGTNWLLEVASDGNYKYVFRHEPDPQEDKLLVIADFMLSTARVSR